MRDSVKKTHRIIVDCLLIAYIFIMPMFLIELLGIDKSIYRIMEE